MVSFLRSLLEILRVHLVGAAAVFFAVVFVLMILLSPGVSSGSYRAGSDFEPAYSYSTPGDSDKVISKSPPPAQQASSGKSRTGGRSIGGGSGHFVNDSTARRRSSLFGDDTTWVVCKDSSSRLAQWKYVRHDGPQVELFPDRTYPLFAYPSQTQLKYEITPDSTLSTIRFRKTYGGQDVKIPLTVSLNDYVKLRSRYELHKLFADEARKSKTLNIKKDIGDVLSNFTKIQIPIPSNPILSIFGKPEINLQISGSVDIRAGFRSTKTDQVTANSFDQTQNTPDFNQEVQVSVNGTIGDKLNILADWNTQRTFEYENQLKIKYTGYDDEIVQSVEAGNVSLQTPSTFIGQSAALFGIKAQFQAGPLKLTTIASQKKGQIKEVEAKGGAQDNPFAIDAWDYATNYYFVDTTYRKYYEPYYQTDPAAVGDGLQQIVEAEVWVQLTGTDQTQIVNSRQGVAHISLAQYTGNGYPDSLRNPNSPQPPGLVEAARFRRLDPSEYELVGSGYIGVIALNAVNDQQVVAVAYRTAGGQQYGDLSRNHPATDTSATFVLKMVKPRNLSSVGPSYTVAWRQMLKNVYSLRLRNIKQDGFQLDVYRRVSGSNPVNTILSDRLLRILNVDRFNVDGTPNANGDNIFDFRPLRTINQARAEVIFPSLSPFDSGMVKYFAAKGVSAPDSLRFHEIYDTTKTAAQQSIHNAYSISGKATGETSSKYTLGFNVVEGSVRVYLRDRLLTPNVDYTVDYILGEVVLRNPDALVPGAPLSIKYEQNDLFQLASKTLIGARGDLFVNSTTSLGFTVLNLNQTSLSDKVRLGEEPNSNTIYGFDGQTSFKLPFLTKALDALPGLQTKEGSELKLSGEAAYMSPNANTRTSTIPSDNGSGIAYIDDFEGSRRTIPIGTNFAQWAQPSAPADTTFGADDTTRMHSKAKTIWYNIFNSVKQTDVWPDRLAGNAANNILTVMDMVYYPTTPGMYNYYNPSPGVVPRHIDTLLRRKNWGGVMKTVSVSGTNLINENIDYIEIWMEVFRNGVPRGFDAAGKIYIDLGAISEDAIPNRELNTEDLVPPSTTINYTLQPWEDVGLDMKADSTELRLYGDLNGDGDPSGDNYNYNNNSADYSHINGTEGNGKSVNGLIPDTEDLNMNGIVDLANSYFRYELSLDTVRARNPRIVGGGIKGSQFFQFRIPIREYTSAVGAPTFENVEYIRVTFQNELDTVYLRFADFSLVGNQWLEQDKSDPTFAVSVVGIEENSNIYSPPPGVIRERDKTRPDEQVYANEQSLSLVLKGIPGGQSRQAIRYYSTRPLDVFNYKTMKMFVHGDDSTMRTGKEAELFFRFGADSLNYYEYRAPIYSGWDSRNEIVIHFADLTAIKQKRDSINQFVQRDVPNGPPGALYGVLGNPSLTQIRYMALGVTNIQRGKVGGRFEGIPPPLFGQVWCDELRVIDVDNTAGWAYRFDASLKLADFGNVSFNYSKVDPFFHAIDQQFGSRQTGTNWGISANAELGKFFPEDWKTAGTTLPISYSHTQSLIQPRYLPSSDVLVSQAMQLEKERLISEGYSEADASAAAAQLGVSSETYRTTDSWASPNFKIGIPSNDWWVRDTWNKLSFGFNYTKSNQRDPTTSYRYSWQWNAKIQYQITMNPDYYFQPFKGIFDGLWLLDEYKDLKIWYSPQSFNWSFSANRSRDVSLQRIDGAQEQTSRNFNASRAMGFGWKGTEGGLLNLSGDYGLNVESSLLSMELDPITGQQRSFSRIFGDMFFGSSLVNFGQDTRYSQHNSLNTRPNIPNIFNIKKYLDLTFGYGVDYSWQNALTQGDIGKAAGWSNNISFSMNLKLKSLFDPLFEDSPSGSPGQGVIHKGVRGRETEEPQQPASPNDTTAGSARPDSTAGQKRGLAKTMDQLKQLARTFIKIPFLDYETVNVTFTQTNNASNSGVVGRPGFVNFWGRIPFFQDADPTYGPSRLYQLGLISDPDGKLTNFGFRPHFPFFGWDMEPGIRAANGVLQNSFRETNRLTFKTSRSLWEGARLDLNWNVGWSYGRTENITTDSLGRIDPSKTILSTNGSVDRSFLSLPDFLFLGSLKSNLKEVANKYQQLKANQSDSASLPDDEKLAQSFEQGFEALPFFRKVFGQFMPRVNWSLRWDGLEKLPMFSGFVSRLSLDHSYSSTYTRSYASLPGGGGERTQGQRVTYGFAPLIGLNFTFKDLLKGSMGANVRYNTNTTYDLAISSQNIVETLAQEISITASYSRHGFEIPFFGLSLNNDLEFNASYSLTKNSQKQYEVATLTVNTDGTPLQGSTRTVLEPRIKYVLSQRVNAAIYYRITKITPDALGSTIPGSTTNEAGLDIHISIQ